MNSAQSMKADVLRRLHRLRGSIRRQLALEAVARLLVVICSLSALSLLVDWRLNLSWPARQVILVVSVIVLSYFLARYLVSPLLAKWHALDIASALDCIGHDQAPNRIRIAPRVATILQLADGPRDNQTMSDALAKLAVHRSFEEFTRIDLTHRLNSNRRRVSWLALTVATLIPLALALARPDVMQLWGRRMFLGSQETWPRTTTLIVVGAKDGRLFVPRGEPTPMEIEVADKVGVTKRLRMRLVFDDGRSDVVTLLRDDAGRFTHELPGLVVSAKIIVWGGDGRLGPVSIQPTNRPHLLDAQVNYQHPWDREPRTHGLLRGDGALSLLPKTEVTLRLVADVPILELAAQWNLDPPPKLHQIDEHEFVATWLHMADTQLKLRLTSDESGLVSHERTVSIGLKKDRVPSVSLTVEGLGRRITPLATVPLHVLARDDYGVQTVDLHLSTDRFQATTNSLDKSPKEEFDDSRVTDESISGESRDNSSKTELLSAPSQIRLFGPERPTTERLVERIHRYDVEPIELQPGDSLRFHATVSDACYIGVQSGRSTAVTLRIVNADELFREILLRQQQLRAKLRHATSIAIDLRDELATAELPEAANDILRRHRIVQRASITVQRGLNESTIELELNRLGSEETTDLIRTQVVDRLDTFNSTLMVSQRRTLEQLRDSAELSHEATQRQAEIVAEMERILARMARWDSFIDVVNQLDTVIKIQHALRAQTQEMLRGDEESIFDD